MVKFNVVQAAYLTKIPYLSMTMWLGRNVDKHAY
jgi:hypothetical protein